MTESGGLNSQVEMRVWLWAKRKAVTKSRVKTPNNLGLRAFDA